MIELAKPEDAEAIVAIQGTTWLDTYPNVAAGITKEDIRVHLEGAHGELVADRIKRWKQRIQTPDKASAVFVARINGETVGYTAPTIIVGQRRVGAMYVLPKAQGQGLGKQLLQKAVDWHKEQDPNASVYLHVASYNSRAIAFYEKFGFRKTDHSATDEIAKLPSGAVIPEIEMIYHQPK